MDSISLEDVVGSVDTPDLFSFVTTDGDMCKMATNLEPVTMQSSAEIDFVGAVDAPDVVSVVTGNTDLLEFTSNMVPCRLVLRHLVLITEEDIVVAVDPPDETIIGYRDVLELTFHIYHRAMFIGVFSSSVFSFMRCCELAIPIIFYSI